ncbi:tumor necrosis factor receptor superfamily member 18 [Trichomycterus rosablanca]|uniref:tumor necrosis factor receptor superfamily member 18 n=1 Tax=Trichomycterus rosablanca TaxID=2290929 RepID=UPI002F355863
MDSIKLWLKVLIMDYVLSMCLDLKCNWKTQYEHRGICCDSCPKANSKTNTRCSCSDKPLCINSDCSDCALRPKCKRGERLKRAGNFKFTYTCTPCPNMTYNDEEDSTCKPITDCSKVGLLVLSAGNRTHNTRCGCHDSNQLTSSIMIAGLVICSLICVALIINLCFQKTTERRVKKMFDFFMFFLPECHPPIHSLVLQSEECGYKLSKEEKGEMCNLNGFHDISSEESTEEKSLEICV